MKWDAFHAGTFYPVKPFCELCHIP